MGAPSHTSRCCSVPAPTRFRDYPAPVSTYTLRNANPAKTRCDAVVVGLVANVQGRDGAPRVARRSRPGLRSQVSGRCWRRSASPARPARSRGCRPAAVPANVLVLVGLGKRGAGLARAVRRAAGVAARNVGNAASVALALPAHDAEPCAPWPRGTSSAATRSRRTSRGPTTRRRRPARSSCSAGRAGRADDRAALEEAQVVAAAVAAPATGSTPRPTTSPRRLFADAVVEAAKRPPRAAAPARSTSRCSTRSSSPTLGCGGILGVGRARPAPPRLVKLTYAPAGRRRATWRSSARASPSTPAACRSSRRSSMATMKSDMAGAAAVVAATFAIAAARAAA